MDVSGSVILPQFLRIGNFVADELNTIIEVEYISKKGINLEPYYRLRSIPISEELLVKIGAVKLDFKDFPSFNLLGIQINFVNGLWIEYVSRVEITGLHHLQNIFFFRNNEELRVGSLTDR